MSGPRCLPAAGRLVGLDLGERRIGVAVCDSAQRLATAAATIVRGRDGAGDRARVAAMVEEYGAAGVVVGLPISLSGQLGPAARAAAGEARALATLLDVPVATHDERLTTVSATRALHAGGRRVRQHRGVVDQVAAAVMLQSWIDQRMGED